MHATTPDTARTLTAHRHPADDRQVVHLTGVLGLIHRILKPGGTFLMQDIAGSSYLEKNLDHPLGAFTYTISTMHCMTVSLAQGGAGLGTMWGEELAERMLNDAGFKQIEKHKLDHDFINVYYVMRR